MKAPPVDDRHSRREVKKERKKKQTERRIQHTEVGVLFLLTSCQIKGKQDKGSFYPSLLLASSHLCSSLSLTSPLHAACTSSHRVLFDRSQDLY